MSCLTTLPNRALVSLALPIFYSNRQIEMGIEIAFITLKWNFLKGTCDINDLLI